MSKKEVVLKTVLIPIISKQENNPDFLYAAIEGFDQVVLLVVIDASAIVGQFGFVAGEIRMATQLVEQIKAFLEGEGKKVFDLIEWGNTPQKIAHTAEMRCCEKIVLAKQENQFFKKLVKQLEAETKVKIESIPVAVSKPASA